MADSVDRLEGPPRPRRVVEEMHAYVPGEQPTDPAIVKLNTNEFPYPPAPEAIEAVRAAADETLRKYPHPTCGPLREALAAECGVDPDWVFVGNGSDEVLRLLFQAYVDPGDEVAITDPTYSLYPVLAAMFGGRLECYPTDADGNLKEAIFEASPRMFVIANPNPPLGTLYDSGTLGRLAAKRESLLIVDEAYVAFAARDCLDMVRQYPNVVISRTFSKSHGLAGMRVGYAIARPEVIKALDTLRDSYNVNRASQAAALAALGARDYYLEKAAEIVRTRESVRESLLELGYEVPRSAGNFVFARSGDGEGMMEALREENVLVRHFDDPALRDGVRITIGTPEEIDRLMEALDQIPSPREAEA